MAIALLTRQTSFLFLFAAIVNGFQSPAPQLHSRVVRCMTSSVIDGEDGSTRGMETPFFASVSDVKGDKSKEKDGIVDWDWEKMANAVFEDDKRPIVLFDGVCNLCDAGINFAMDQDESARFRFCSLQSKVAQSLLLRSGKAADDTSNIVLITEDDAFFSSDAVSRICMGLDAQPLQWFGHLGQYTPPWIRESLYLFVSKNRYKFGENDSCRLDFDGTYTSRFVSDPTNQGGDGI